MRATKFAVVSVLTILFSNPTSAFVLSDVSPFIPPFLDNLDFIASSNVSSANPQGGDVSNSDLLGQELRKRGSCPANYNSCSTLAAADAGSCCTKNAICSLDAANHVACCPTGAVCTGTISIPTSTTATTTTSGFALGGSTTSTATGVSSTTFTSTTATTTGTATTSFLSNTYDVPFPIIASTYSNSLLCLSAFTACQSNYARCTSDLQGGGAFGVTISAANGGTTVAEATGTLGVESAVAVCSSLSSVACLGLQTGQCTEFGSATGTASSTVGFITGSSGGGRCGARGVVALAAAAVGVVGAMA